MNVLTVDDSRGHWLVIRQYMTDFGFQVAEAADGAEGLTQMKRSTKFDLILVDNEMPGMNGLEFIRQVRADAALGQTPIIMTADTNSTDQMVKAIEAGASEYILKPVSKEALATKLDILGIEHK